MDYRELCENLEKMGEELLSRDRYAHSRRVAAVASELCQLHGFDAQRGRAAGLAHDLCKEMPKKVQRELAIQYEGIDMYSSLMADKVMHGPAAAVLISREFGVDDEALLEAIAHHTVGRLGMTGLSTILYCADKLEPGRERIESGFRLQTLNLPLDQMLLSVIERSIAWMRSQRKDVAPETLILYSSLLQNRVQKQ